MDPLLGGTVPPQPLEDPSLLVKESAQILASYLIDCWGRKLSQNCVCGASLWIHAGVETLFEQLDGAIEAGSDVGGGDPEVTGGFG